MSYTIKQAAQLAGQSVRTLRYYDQIGLLVPQSHTQSGYRLYGERELVRLQRILFYKEMGFSLTQIRLLLEIPEAEQTEHLQAQKRLLELSVMRLEKIIGLLERTITCQKRGDRMKDPERFDAFDRKEILRQQQQYQREIQEKYDPALVAQSRQREQKRTDAQFKELMQAQREIEQTLAQCLLQHLPPENGQVQQATAAWHRLIDENYYDCSLEVFSGLGKLYVEDERFAAHYEALCPGLAAYFCAAIQAFCSRTE